VVEVEADGLGVVKVLDTLGALGKAGADGPDAV
jgi:hypothetical protein